MKRIASFEYTPHTIRLNTEKIHVYPSSVFKFNIQVTQKHTHDMTGPCTGVHSTSTSTSLLVYWYSWTYRYMTHTILYVMYIVYYIESLGGPVFLKSQKKN